MYRLVKVMPGPPKWHTKIITLPEAPDEPQTFFYCNLEACTHYLFQRPDLTPYMEYMPKCVYDENGDHVFHEMCTTTEWEKQQVRYQCT